MFGNMTGTAFTIDVNSKQYLVTARHVVEGIRSTDNIKILHERQWKSVSVDVVGLGEDEADVAVLKASLQLSPTYPLAATQEGLIYGQQVYFVGFPFGWDGGAEYINRGFSMPFVRTGIVSAILPGTGSKNTGSIYIDAFGNKGFSGGPVVFRPAANGRGETGDFCVAGIIVRYPSPPSHLLRPIIDRERNPIVGSDGMPIGYFEENPSFVVAVGIGHALGLIDVHPDGLKGT